MMRIIKLHDVEAAFIHAKMDVALLEVWGMCFPDLRVRIFFLDHPPDGLPDPPAVTIRIDVEQIQFIALGVRMNIDDNAADRLAVSDDPKRLREFP